MKKIFLILIFLLNLCIEINQTGMRLCLYTPTVSAQYMGNESFYECEDDGFEYTSPWPCEDDPCIQACTYPDCDVSLPCDEMIFHQNEDHPDEDPFDDEDLGDNNGGDDDLWGDTDTGGFDVVIPPVTPPTTGDQVEVGDDEYVEIGKAYWDKMEEDMRNNNYVVYKATIKKEDKSINNLNTMSNISTVQSIVDLALSNVPNVADNIVYKSLAQTLSHFGVGLNIANTAVILMEPDDEITTGDVLGIVSNVMCGAAVYLYYIPEYGFLLGTAATSVGVCCGIISMFVNLNDMEIKLKNGYVIHFELLKA